jgi:hypothetical protein
MDATVARIRRTVANVVITLLLAVLVIDNLPDSELKQSVRPVVKPIETHLAVGQNWALFAPNPPRSQVVFVARVEYDDGSVAHWELPDWKGTVFASYANYRWRKWGEALMHSRNEERLEQAARAIASFSKPPGREVRHVSIWEHRIRVGRGEDPTTNRNHLISVTIGEGS